QLTERHTLTAVAPSRSSRMRLAIDVVMSTMLAPRFAARTITLDHPLRPIDRERPGRRRLNIAVATVGLVLLLPLMLVIAVLIKLTSRGPVLFKQTRVGLDRRALSRMGGNTRRRIDLGGHPYTMYKFRTMYVANRGADRQVWAQPDDARVTPLGRLLRRFRLDELPQLFNVLKGDMNVVGPRPEQPAIFVDLRGQIEGYQRRHPRSLPVASSRIAADSSRASVSRSHIARRARNRLARSFSLGPSGAWTTARPSSRRRLHSHRWIRPRPFGSMNTLIWTRSIRL